MSRLFSLFLVALLPLTSHAAEPLSPDQLLERIRSDRAAEASAMQAREQDFVRDCFPVPVPHWPSRRPRPSD